ncbi:hypothetical protein [Adhaeribacter pallidiroseus]|uniref:Uncharacterized protein n=1 Tax=Adhaeribacter pallidiroseus TaxID=2072847 RepID=A0A369QM49_9BACT|nr:hypothetical protein [Adhaeribacter pallidiroseus]RDC65442.1 hypothetical protein AHMF7616_04072 [Adhaeribacter pallidiroseus]
MTKQKLVTVLTYALGVLGASLGLLFLDFLQTASKGSYALPLHFWERLFGLFFIYMAGAYLVVILGNKDKTDIFWREPITPEE